MVVLQGTDPADPLNRSLIAQLAAQRVGRVCRVNHNPSSLNDRHRLIDKAHLRRLGMNRKKLAHISVSCPWGGAVCTALVLRRSLQTPQSTTCPMASAFPVALTLSIVFPKRPSPPASLRCSRLNLPHKASHDENPNQQKHARFGQKPAATTALHHPPWAAH